MKKIILISLGCLVVVGLIIILAPSNIFNFFDRTTTVNKYQSSEGIATIVVPKGWINKPYFPGGTGAEITLFPSLKDELIAIYESMRDSKKDFSEVIEEPNGDIGSGSNARNIDGLVFTQASTDPNFLDNMTDKKTNFDKVLVENKTLSDGNYRCLQNKLKDHFWVSCYLRLDNNASVYYHLNTFSKSYNKDLAVFYKVIESTKVIK